VGCAEVGCAEVGCAEVGCAEVGCAEVGCAEDIVTLYPKIILFSINITSSFPTLTFKIFI